MPKNTKKIVLTKIAFLKGTPAEVKINVYFL